MYIQFHSTGIFLIQVAGWFGLNSYNKFGLTKACLKLTVLYIPSLILLVCPPSKSQNIPKWNWKFAMISLVHIDCRLQALLRSQEFQQWELDRRCSNCCIKGDMLRSLSVHRTVLKYIYKLYWYKKQIKSCNNGSRNMQFPWSLAGMSLRSKNVFDSILQMLSTVFFYTRFGSCAGVNSVYFEQLM